MVDKKKAFEDSFKGYHKEAPAFLHSKSKALSKARGGSLIERHNAMIAKRDAGKTKEEMSEAAFKSGRTSGRY